MDNYFWHKVYHLIFFFLFFTSTKHLTMMRPTLSTLMVDRGIPNFVVVRLSKELEVLTDAGLFYMSSNGAVVQWFLEKKVVLCKLSDRTFPFSTVIQRMSLALPIATAKALFSTPPPCVRAVFPLANDLIYDEGKGNDLESWATTTFVERLPLVYHQFKETTVGMSFLSLPHLQDTYRRIFSMYIKEMSSILTEKSLKGHFSLMKLLGGNRSPSTMERLLETSHSVQQGTVFRHFIHLLRTTYTVLDGDVPALHLFQLRVLRECQPSNRQKRPRAVIRKRTYRDKRPPRMQTNLPFRLPDDIIDKMPRFKSRK